MTYDPNRWRSAAFDTWSSIDAGLRRYMLQVHNYMAGGLAVTGATAIFALYSGLYTAIAGSPLMWLIVLAPLGIAFFLGSRTQRMSPGMAQMAFWCYAVLIGLSLTGIFFVYTGISIAQAFFVAAATFLAMSLWGYTRNCDLSRFGSFLVMGLIGVILAGLVNLILGSTSLQFAISAAGVLIFTGLTAWDTQRIREQYYAVQDVLIPPNVAIRGALALYLAFISQFLSLLQLFGHRRDR